MSEVASPLANIIRKAAAVDVKGPVAELRRRFVDASDAIFLLCDVSGSMLDYVGNANMRKCDALQIAVDDVLKYHPKIRVVAFASYPVELGPHDKIPEPGARLGGSTDLAKAIESIQRYKPRKTIIVSDGLPDNPKAAEAAAGQLTGAVDTIYCGPEEHEAIQFLTGLARQCGGTAYSEVHGYSEISSAIKGLLPPP